MWFHIIAVVLFFIAIALTAVTAWRKDKLFLVFMGMAIVLGILGFWTG